MSLPWLTINKNLETGIILLNSINLETFIKISNHVLVQENSFTPQDLLALQESLRISENEVKLLIQSLHYIFKQSTKVVLKPTDLQKQLVEALKFKSEKADEFVKLWTKNAKEHFENLENRLQVDNVAWELNLQTASSLNRKEMIPNVRVQLGLATLEGDSKRPIAFEMNEEELYKLHSTLESIQSKLDSIQST